MSSILRTRADIDSSRAIGKLDLLRNPAFLPPRVGTLDRTLLTLALLSATLLRVIGLNSVGLNSDEAVYAAQSASLAGNPNFTPLFPVVRAHPLLLQVLMSPLYHAGRPDTVGRYVTAAFGVATVALVYVLGAVMFERRVGAVGALVLAIMPYHVMISRQILLDGPMAFFATAALTCLAVFARTHRGYWMVAAGGCLGLAALSKETAIILVGSVFVFMCLVNRLWRPIRFVVAGAVLALGMAFSYPMLTSLAGGSRSGQSYLLWQLTRTPNHSFAFYLVVVGGSMGFALLAAAAVGLWPRISGRVISWRETLLLSWVAVPVLFFQVWPVKGYSYLTLAAPVAALLAARTLCPPPDASVSRRRRLVAGLAAAACLVTLAVPAVRNIASPATSGLAGAGGLPGGRQTGQWVATNIPHGAQLMTIGPTMANVIQYYSGRRCDALSVSPNPLHRNPSYRPIINADLALREGLYQYVVWDTYSAHRSVMFGTRAQQLISRFHGQAIHVERGTFLGKADQPLIVIYKVSP